MYTLFIFKSLIKFSTQDHIQVCVRLNESLVSTMATCFIKGFRNRMVWVETDMALVDKVHYPTCCKDNSIVLMGSNTLFPLFTSRVISFQAVETAIYKALLVAYLTF